MNLKRPDKRYIVLYSFFGLSFILVSWGMLNSYLVLKDIKQPLVLHFNEQTLITQRGDINSLLGAGATMLVGIGINLFLSQNLKNKDFFLSIFVAGFTLFLSILFFIGFQVIIQVN